MVAPAAPVSTKQAHPAKRESHLARRRRRTAASAVRASRATTLFHKRSANARIVAGGGLCEGPRPRLAASGGSPEVARHVRVARPVGPRRTEPGPIFTVAGGTLAERGKALRVAKGGGKPFAAGDVDLLKVRLGNRNPLRFRRCGIPSPAGARSP